MYKYLLRAARRTHANSRKFASGYERVKSSQNFSCFREFSQFGRKNKPETRHAQIQIINALQLGQRNKAHEMLVDLSCVHGSLTADDFDYILEYCAQTPDLSFVLEAWNILVKNEIDKKKKSYRCVIEAFSKVGYFKEAFEWLTSLEESNNFHADLPLYNIILRECVNKQSLIDFGRCLELMDDQLLGRSEITYWELLKHSVLQKSLFTVHDIWKYCIKHYTPSILFLRKFVWAFTKLHDFESAYKVLQYMIFNFKRKYGTLRKSSAGRYQSSWLDIPIPPACELSYAGSKLKNHSFQTMFTAQSVETENAFGALDVSAVNFSGDCIIDDHLSTTTFFGNHGSRLFGKAKEKYACYQISSFDAVAAEINNQYLLVKKDEMGEHTTGCIQNQNFDCFIPKEAKYIPFVNAMRWSFNDLIHYCSQTGKWELAELLFLQMQALGVEPSPHTYDGLIKAVSHGRSLAYGLELMESMEIKGMKPCNDTLSHLSIEHSKNLKLNMAELLLKRISDNHPKYIHPFNAFLVACDIMDEPERAVKLLAKLKDLNIRPNIRTYEVLFSLFGNVNAPYERGNWPSHMHAAERIRHIEMDMKINGVQHSYASMKNLVRALGMEGMIPEMFQRLVNVEKLSLAIKPHQITDLYNIVLHTLVEAEHSQTAIEYFRRMRSYGFLADAATYHIMLECCSLVASFRLALAFTSLMLRDGFFPQTMTYTALLKVLLATDDFNGALDVFNQASCDEIQLDVHFFNEILQYACTKISSKEEEKHAKGLIDVIELILEQMRRNKVKPDPSTCTYACSAYAELDFHSTAVEVLRVLSLRMISEDDVDLHEKRTRFEDLVCSEDPSVESKIVSIFKGGEEYIAVGLLNLRLCTFVMGHPLSWSTEDSLWAQRLSSSFPSKKHLFS